MAFNLLDEVVRHQIDLVQYSNGVVRRIIAVLNRTDADLFAQLTAALEELAPESFTVERLEALLAGVRRLNADAYARVKDEIAGFAREIAAAEVEWVSGIYRNVRTAVNLVGVTAEQVYAAAMARPFQGRLLREWAASIEAGRMTRIRDAVRIGYVEGETVSAVVRRIRGTKAAGYADGIIEIDRRYAETIVRSALSHTAGVARDRFNEANADIAREVVWISTLDSRTSEMCLIRDGLHYRVAKDGRYRPVGHSIPWGAGPGRAHFSCRSTSIALLDGQEELYGTRASVQYKDGEQPKGAQVPANETYGQWLRRQPAETQDEVLGPTRGKLFRSGGLEVRDFANAKGIWITLDELRRRNAAAFERAGL